MTNQADRFDLIMAAWKADPRIPVLEPITERVVGVHPGGETAAGAARGDPVALAPRERDYARDDELDQDTEWDEEGPDWGEQDDMDGVW